MYRPKGNANLVKHIQYKASEDETQYDSEQTTKQIA